MKLHFAVNVESHEVVSMEVSTDDTHDVKVLPGLLEGAGRNVGVARVLGDGAYDSSAVYDFPGERGIEAVVKHRGNSRPDRGSPVRRRAVELVQCLGYEG